MNKVLIVDDEMELCDLIALQLTEEGYDTIKAYGMKEAINKFKDHSPNVVLSDMQMPGGTGVELFKKLKELPSKVSFRFYILSGFISMNEKELIDYGISGIITKPMLISDILNAISKTN